MTHVRNLGSPVRGNSENLSSEILMLISSSGPLLSASPLAGRAELYDAEVRTKNARSILGACGVWCTRLRSEPS